MPTLQCKRDVLFELLEKKYTDKEFDELCFQFGVELDEVTSEREMAEREQEGDHSNLSDQAIYKIDLPANRYDLLSVEGFAIALRVFLGKIDPPLYRVVPVAPHVMKVSNSVKGVRDYVVCAVLRNLNFTPDSYASFIDLQEKMHQNLARKRTLVSVGTHDLDTVQGPFKYDAVPFETISFVPLNKEEVVNGTNFIQFYKSDTHLNKYLHMIEGKSHWPLVRDNNSVIMSLPPIINSRHSAITLNTKNVFIEATAVDQYKAKVVVNQIIASFSLYCKEQFTVEPVSVEYEDGTVVMCPDLSVREMECSAEWINDCVGIQQNINEMAASLKKMMLDCSPKDDQTIIVKIPPTRSDIISACDVMEDVAIAYGYDNIVRKAIPTISAGQQNPISKLTHMLRLEFAQAGYNESLTLGLCSIDDSYTSMRKKFDPNQAVTIANPQTKEFQMCRISLLPGLLKALNVSRAQPLPIRLFEVSDVVEKDSSADVGARNKRMAAALFCSNQAGLEYIHGLADNMMTMLGSHPRSPENPNGYYLKPSEDASYFAGRQAGIFIGERPIGIFGILHPEVLKAYDIRFLVSALEFEVEPFL